MSNLILKLFKKTLNLAKQPEKIIRFIRQPSLVLQNYRDVKNEDILNKGERTIIYDWGKERKRKESISNWGHLGIIFRYEWSLDFVKGLKVLDAGCAVGYGPYYFSSKGAKEVTGLDNSTDAINWAKKHYNLPNLKFLLGDCLNMPFEDNSFDAVVSFDLLEHITEIQQKIFISEIKRILRPDGLVIMGTPNASADETAILRVSTVFHKRELDKREFQELLEKYFDQVEIKGEDMVVNGKRLKDKWLEYLKNNKVSIDNIKMVDDDIEKTRGLIAICKKPKK